MNPPRLTNSMDFMMSVILCINLGKRKYSLKVWKLFVDVFNCLPLSALIEDKIFCMHGGIGPELTKISTLMKINRPT